MANMCVLSNQHECDGCDLCIDNYDEEYDTDLWDEIEYDSSINYAPLFFEDYKEVTK